MRLAAVLGTHEGLAAAGRLPALPVTGRMISALELGVLILAGVSAALLSTLVDLKLQIPGHAILRVILPLSLGLALVPRNLAGSVMGVSALLTAVALSLGHVARSGPGAWTSLCLTGPLLDIALWRARQGWRLYLGFALAGLASNLVALAVRAAPKLAGLDGPGTRPLELWWPTAVLTYSACGLLAGVLSALLWFRFRSGRRRELPQESAA